MNLRPSTDCLYIDLNGIQEVDVDTLNAIVDSTSEQATNGPRSMIVDMSDVRIMGIQARKWLSSVERHNVARLALISTNPISRLIAGFIAHNTQRQLLVNHFENEESARVWCHAPALTT